jgi:hypothetical protein
MYFSSPNAFWDVQMQYLFLYEADSGAAWRCTCRGDVIATVTCAQVLVEGK